MTSAQTLATEQAEDLAAWFAAHLPMDMRRTLMAERPLLYEALFPGCGHAAISVRRMAVGLRAQKRDRMIATSRPAGEYLLSLIQGADHPWDGDDTVDAVTRFMGDLGVSVPGADEDTADDVADAKRRLAVRLLAAVPDELRTAADETLTSLLGLAEGSLDDAARAELVRAVNEDE